MSAVICRFCRWAGANCTAIFCHLSILCEHFRFLFISRPAQPVSILHMNILYIYCDEIFSGNVGFLVCCRWLALKWNGKMTFLQKNKSEFFFQSIVIVFCTVSPGIRSKNAKKINKGNDCFN